MKPPLDRLGLGGAALGVLFDPIADTDAAAVIDEAWRVGIRFYDSSPLYGGGLSEQRIGRALKDKPRQDFFMATKTGVTRPFGQAAAPPGGTRRAADVWDYSADGTRRSIEHSLGRLLMDRVDLVHLHDVEGRTDAAMEAYKPLRDLQEAGIVGGVGIGANRVDAPLDLMSRARFDAVLVAGRYSLLDQDMLRLVPAAEASRTRLIVGGVFNSGILASGDRPGATYDYDPASDQIRARVALIEAACRAHDVPLRAAALQFPLGQPATSVMLLGARSLDEFNDCMAMLAIDVPKALWRRLQTEGLIDRSCPLP